MESNAIKYNMWQNTGFMIKTAWEKSKAVIFLCALSGVLAFLVSLAELYFAPAVLEIVESKQPLEKLLGTIAFFSLALIILKAIKEYVRMNVTTDRVAIRTGLLSDAQLKLATMSYPLTENERVLALFSKMGEAMYSNNSAAEAIWDTLAKLVEAILGFIVYMLLLNRVDTVLLLVVTLTSAASYFSSKRLSAWGYRHREEEAEYEHRCDYLGKKAQDYTLAKDIRIFGISAWLIDVFSGVYKLYHDFHARAARVYIWADVIDAAFALLRNGIAYFYLIAMALRGELSAAEFLLYFTAVSGFTAFVREILSNLSDLHDHGLKLASLREVMDIKETFKFEDGEPLEPVRGAPYKIELRNVSYRYEGADDFTLKNVDLTIAPGEKLAIVGLNGAGKTTLVKLVTGLYDPTEGEVLLNGEDIRKYNRRDYYRHFSAVFQDFSVLPASIAENVAQKSIASSADADMDKLKECLVKAGLWEKLSSLPDGLSSKLGKQVYDEAIELSGGETQRLMLARALYKDAPIIVLDEPTAALDPISESDLYMRYGELSGGNTSLYISHRLASTRFCDRIILIKDGGIKEEGTHAQLLAAGGDYSELFEIQSRYYMEEGGEDEAK